MCNDTKERYRPDGMEFLKIKIKIASYWSSFHDESHPMIPHGQKKKICKNDDIKVKVIWSLSCLPYSVQLDCNHK